MHNKIKRQILMPCALNPVLKEEITSRKIDRLNQYVLDFPTKFYLTMES